MHSIKNIMVCLLIFLTSNVSAGLKKSDVSLKIEDISSNHKKITGTMAATRASEDDISELSVSIYNYRDTFYTAEIRAVNDVGHILSCRTDDYQIIRLLQSVKADSHIKVIRDIYDNTNKCLNVIVKNSSAYAPKKP